MVTAIGGQAFGAGERMFLGRDLVVGDPVYHKARPDWNVGIIQSISDETGTHTCLFWADHASFQAGCRPENLGHAALFVQALRAATPTPDSERAGGSEPGDLIRDAAKLIEPADGEAVFYIRVGGAMTQMRVKTKGDVDPDAALKNAIAALEGERGGLSNCPAHTPERAGGSEAVEVTQNQHSPVVADYGEHFLVAHVSKDGTLVGIDHPCDAVWADVMTAHVALRDRINERIAEQDGCPFKPAALAQPTK